MNAMTTLLLYGLLGLAVATLSITLTRARIFKPVRDWLQTKDALAFKLASCPYCAAHWFSLLVAPFVLTPLTGVLVVDLIASWLALTGVAALFEGLLMHGLLMQESYILELERQIAEFKPGIDPIEAQQAIDAAYQDGLVRGQHVERERYCSTEVRLRGPIASA